MSVIFILLFASIFVTTIFLIAFLRSAKKGQFDDADGSPVRMLFDDLPKSNKQ